MIRLARRLLALAALVAGAGAALAGSALPAPERDEIGAVELAQWLRDGRDDVHLLDLRDATQAQDALPGARLLSAVDVGAYGAGDTLVLYSGRDADVRVAARVRARTPAGRVLRLDGGEAAWRTDVLYPQVRDDAPAATVHEFAARARLSRYFGGTPRRVDAGATVARVRSRRGC